jgi:hypothetical protein
LRLSLDGGRTFLEEFCFNKVNVVPYDGGSYDSVIAVPGRRDTLLLTYAVSSSPFEMRIMGAKNATFCAIYVQNVSFYQDRLGTNIGKALKKSVVFRRDVRLSAPEGGSSRSGDRQ